MTRIGNSVIRNHLTSLPQRVGHNKKAFYSPDRIFLKNPNTTNAILPTSVLCYHSKVTKRNPQLRVLLKAPYCPHPMRLLIDLRNNPHHQTTPILLSDELCTMLLRVALKRLETVVGETLDRETETECCRRLWPLLTEFGHTRGLATCSAMLELCALLGDIATALLVTDHMADQKIPRHVDHYTYVLTACAKVPDMPQSVVVAREVFRMCPVTPELLATYFHCCNTVDDVQAAYTLLGKFNGREAGVAAYCAFLDACSRIPEPGEIGCTMGFSAYKIACDIFCQNSQPPEALMNSLCLVTASHGRTIETNMTRLAIQRTHGMAAEKFSRGAYLWSFVVAGTIGYAVRALIFYVMNHTVFDDSAVPIVLHKASWEMALMIINLYWKFRRTPNTLTVAMILDKLRSRPTVVWKVLVRTLAVRHMRPCRFVLGVLYEMIRTGKDHPRRRHMESYVAGYVFEFLGVQCLHVPGESPVRPQSDKAIAVVGPPKTESGWLGSWQAKVDGFDVVIFPFETLFAVYVAIDAGLVSQSTRSAWRAALSMGVSSSQSGQRWRFDFLPLGEEQGVPEATAMLQEESPQGMESVLAGEIVESSRRPFAVRQDASRDGLFVRYMRAEQFKASAAAMDPQNAALISPPVDLEKQNQRVLQDVKVWD